MTQIDTKPLKLFISYSNKDKNYLDEVLEALGPIENQGIIVLHSDKSLKTSDQWVESIKSMVQEADIHLFLVSPDSLLSTFIQAEIKIATDKYREGKAVILPLLVKDCNFKSSPLSEYFFIGGPRLEALDPLDQEGKNRIYSILYDTILNLSQGKRIDNSSAVEVIIEKAKNNNEEIINLSNCELKFIPTILLSLKGIKTLLLSNNQLTDISSLRNIESLENLYLASNKISEVSALGNLQQLKLLDLSNNYLIDVHLLTCPGLTHLYLKNNLINSLPSFTVLNSLIHLDLSSNKIKNIPGQYDMPNLQVLNVSQNAISKIEGLEKMKSLKDLNLANNKLSKIENLEELENLEILDLYGNEIDSLENIDGLKLIKTLGVSKNKLTSLNGVENLESIRVIYASHNLIEEVFPLQSLKKIERVILTGNRIKNLLHLKWFFENNFNIKYEFSFDPTQKGIFVKDNPIEYPPIEILNRGNEDIIRYFEQQDSALREQVQPYINNDLKIILIGNPNVGKSHLAEYIISGRTNLPSHNASTKGMITISTILKNKYSLKDINVTIFDFGGQEYYHDTHHLFFTTDTVYLLLWEKDTNVFNQRRTEKRYNNSLNQYLDETNSVFPLEYWLDAVHYFCGRTDEEETRNNQVDPLLILVETKRPKNGITLLNTSRLINYSSLIHSQQAINISWDGGSISDVGGDAFFDNLHDLISNITTKLLPGYYQYIVEFFKNFLGVNEQSIFAASGIQGFICDINQVESIFNSIMSYRKFEYRFNGEHTRDLCRFLANRGWILFFEQDQTTICLNPHQLTEEIYIILNKTYLTQGHISESESKLLKNEVLEIMTLFNLIIPDLLQKGYIIPQLLPNEPEQATHIFISSFKPPCVRYEIFGYIHKSLVQNLFASFMTNLFKGTQVNYYWKNGFVIRQRSNELYSISFSNEISKQKRYINIQYLNNLIPVEINEIMTKIENTFKRHTFQKEVSINGIEYIPFSKIQENIMLSNFTHENKAYRIADYKSFIKAEDRKFEMKKLFISYSSRNTIFKDRFITHLAPHKRNGMIDVWHDRDIETGEKWEAAILAEIDNSDLIIFLLSPDFINTNYIFDVEIPKAMERNKQNLAKFHFIILKSCQWEATVLNEYMMQLQSGFDGKKLVTIGHPDNDDQWTEAVKDLMAKLYAQKQV